MITIDLGGLFRGLFLVAYITRGQALQMELYYRLLGRRYAVHHHTRRGIPRLIVRRRHTVRL